MEFHVLHNPTLTWMKGFYLKWKHLSYLHVLCRILFPLMLLIEAEFLDLERRISCECVTVFEITIKEITIFLSEMLWIWRTKHQGTETESIAPSFNRILHSKIIRIQGLEMCYGSGQLLWRWRADGEKQRQMKKVHNSSFEETGAHFWRNPILQCRDIIAQSTYTCLSHKEVAKRGGETTSG